MKNTIKFLVIITLLTTLLICSNVSANVWSTPESMTDTPILYQLDYGTPNVTLLQYSFTSSVNLDPVQNWTIYGSNNGTGWDSLDVRDNYGFTTGNPNAFNINSAPKYQYYQIYLRTGFYDLSGILTISLNTTANVTPKPIKPQQTVYVYDNNIPLPAIIPVLAILIFIIFWVRIRK